MCDLTGPVENLIACSFTHESDQVVMEIGSGRQLQDSEPAPLGNLMRELESAGVVDATLNGHVIERVAGVAGHGNVCIYAKVMSEVRTAMRLRNDLL